MSQDEQEETRVTIDYKSTPMFNEILSKLKMSLMVSTHQAKYVIVLSGSSENEWPDARFLYFTKVMGLAFKYNQIAVGTINHVWFLNRNAKLLKRVQHIDPRYDAAFFVHSTRFTNEVDIHELSYCGENVEFVGTAISSLCKFDHEHNYVPYWNPPFISKVAAEDRCHLNGFAVENGKPQFVSMFSETDTKEGWRENRDTTGCIMHVDTGKVIKRGLSMPHSPRIHQGKLLVLDSGNGKLLYIDENDGSKVEIVSFNGYPRGMCLIGRFAFVGLSMTRENIKEGTFDNTPLKKSGIELMCGVAVVDLNLKEVVAYLRFDSEVEEIYDVQILPFAYPYVGSPFPQMDKTEMAVVIP